MSCRCHTHYFFRRPGNHPALNLVQVREDPLEESRESFTSDLRTAPAMRVLTWRGPEPLALTFWNGMAPRKGLCNLRALVYPTRRTMEVITPDL